MRGARGNKEGGRKEGTGGGGSNRKTFVRHQCRGALNHDIGGGGQGEGEENTMAQGKWGEFQSISSKSGLGNAAVQGRGKGDVRISGRGTGHYGKGSKSQPL